jgi:hypothetical protein
MSDAQPDLDHLSGWRASGFAQELVPVCGPTDSCSHPGKRPHLKGWQTAKIPPSEFKPGMNLGLRTRYFPALDIDVEDPGIVAAVTDVARELFGSTAQRHRSNSPRCALLYKLEGEPFKKASVTFTAPDGSNAKIEFLGDGQQLVVAGVHHTNAPLEWDGAPPSADKLACITKETRDEFLSAMRNVLESAGCRDIKIDSGETHNGAVKKTDTVRTGNGSPREHAYALAALKRACEAIRGAGQGDRNDTLNREAFGIAQLVAGGMLDAASAELALEAAAEECGLAPREIQATLRSAFGVGERNPRGLPPADASPFSTGTAPLLEARRISLEDARTPPVERFILGPMLPLEKASVVFGPTSIGKSAAIAQIAFHLAGGSESLWGLPLLPGGAPVLVYSAEDTLDDWKRKAAAIRNAGGIDMDRALEHLYVIDKSEGIARLSEVVTVRTEGLIPGRTVTRREACPTGEQERLIAEARRIGARLIVVETASRLVDDEDNASFAALMAALGRIGRETGAAILLSHHATKAASKDNDSAIENARGGGALIANARNALSLFPADEQLANEYRNRFPAEDLAVLVHGKGTSSTRRHAPIVLVRCDATYGAVFHLPDEVSLSAEMERVNAERLELQRRREMDDLKRLFAVVEQVLPIRPSISPSWLRDNKAKDLGVSKHRVEPLVQRALDRGVLKVKRRTERGITVTLGEDPRRPDFSGAPTWASPGESGVGDA